MNWKKNSLIASAVLGLFSASLSATADDSINFESKVTIQKNCEFNFDTAFMGFGTLQPESKRNVSSGFAIMTYGCTNGSQYNLKVNNGNRDAFLKLENDPTKTIKYSFSSPVLTTDIGQGFETGVGYMPSATIVFNDYENSKPGNYTDVVIVELTE